MTQLKIKDFFKDEENQSILASDNDLALFNQHTRNLEVTESNISFHSFKFGSGFDNKNMSSNGLLSRFTHLSATRDNPSNTFTAGISRLGDQKQKSEALKFSTRNEQNSANKNQDTDDRSISGLDGEFPGVYRSGESQKLSQNELEREVEIKRVRSQVSMFGGSGVPESNPKKLDEYFKRMLIVDVQDQNQRLLRKRRRQSKDRIAGMSKSEKKIKLNTLDYFIKVKKKQVFYWRKMGKRCTLRVMSFLTLSEIARLSGVCHFFRMCYKQIWMNSEFFQKMDLSKYTEAEIRKIRQMDQFCLHKAILAPLFIGKNMAAVLKKMRVKYTTTDSLTQKRGALLELCIGPVKSKKTSGLLKINNVNSLEDKNLIPVLETSQKTLTYLNLTSCTLISAKSFAAISKIENLKKLAIIGNKEIEDHHLEEILTGLETSSKLKECELTHINLSRCTNLSGNSINAIVKKCPNLEALVIKSNPFMMDDFTEVRKLKNLQKFTTLNMDCSKLLDAKLIILVRELPNLRLINLSNCNNLTLDGFKQVVELAKGKVSKICIRGSKLAQNKANEIRKLDTGNVIIKL